MGPASHNSNPIAMGSITNRAHRATKWKDLNMSDQINYLLREINMLTQHAKLLSKIIDDLQIHQHDTSGSIFIKKRIGTGLMPEDSYISSYIPRPSGQSLPAMDEEEVLI